MEYTRREYLATVAGVVGLGATAGCLGGGERGTDDCTIEDEPSVSELPAPALGSDDASVTVAAFEDFSCPHCATYSLEVLPEIRAEYVETGVARYEHHDFPIPVDERWSWQAASAARGVQDETDDATFFEYAHDLFENQDAYAAGLLTDLANDVGAPGCAIQADALNETYRPVLEADRQLGIDRGVEGTPAVFVAGRPVRPTYDAIAAAIEAER
jgi:protein-disulfide isomerase